MAARCIRYPLPCRLAQAWVYDTDAGLIIAYNQKHADDKAREVMEEQDAMNDQLHDEIEDLLL